MRSNNCTVQNTAQCRISTNINEILKFYSYNNSHDSDELFEVMEILFDEIFDNDIVLKYFNEISRYPLLEQHSFNTAALTALLCIKAGLHINTTESTVIGALLHDLGLVEIYDKYMYLYDTNHKLTRDELLLKQSHPLNGFNLLKNDNNISPLSKKIILFHHVWNNYDASYDAKDEIYTSYPRYFKNVEVKKDYKIFAVQIVQSTTNFLNLINRYGLTRLEALQRIEFEKNVHLGDASILLLNFISPYSLGERVMLNNGLQAQIFRHSVVPNKPIVKITDGRLRNKIIDLSSNDISILRSI